MRIQATLFLTAVLTASAAQAMPNFARRMNASCDLCHTTIPRLNRYGYEYRNAGYRDPNALGQAEKDINFGDLNTARIQNQLAWTRTRNAKGAVSARGSIQFVEATLYPVTGAWGRWFSSEGELSVAPEDFFEVENAYVRGTFGGAEAHFNARIGVFHPFEGYGASDRPVTIARPLLQTAAANDASTGSTFFTTWGFDQVGAEVGYTFKGFNATAAILNGIFVRNEEGTLHAFPFQGGGLSRPNNDPNFNSKDFQVFLNQFLWGEAAVSAEYYHGTFTLPLATGATWTDRFDRAALYLTIPVLADRLYLLGGEQLGWDHRLDKPTGTAAEDRFLSTGTFGEVFFRYNAMLGAAARYDTFDPSRSTANNAIQAVTAGINYALLNGAQAILQYRFQDTKASATTSSQSHAVQLRLIYIF